MAVIISLTVGNAVRGIWVDASHSLDRTNAFWHYGSWYWVAVVGVELIQRGDDVGFGVHWPGAQPDARNA